MLKLRAIVQWLFLFCFSGMAFSQTYPRIGSSHPQVRLSEFSGYVINCSELVWSPQFQVFIFNNDSLFNGYDLYDDLSQKLTQTRRLSLTGDTTTVTDYFESGNIRSVTTSYGRDGKSINELVSFYDSGKLMQQESYPIDTLQFHRTYYENGNPEHEWTTLLFEPYGTMRYYYPNGQLSACYEFRGAGETLIQTHRYAERTPLFTFFYDSLGNPAEEDLYLRQYVHFNHHPYWEKMKQKRYPEGVLSLPDVVGQPHYDFLMEELTDSLRARLVIPESCSCKIGIATLDLLIQTDGTITINTVSFLKPEVADAIRQAILSLEKWFPAHDEHGNPSRFAIETDFLFAE